MYIKRTNRESESCSFLPTRKDTVHGEILSQGLEENFIRQAYSIYGTSNNKNIISVSRKKCCLNWKVLLTFVVASTTTRQTTLDFISAIHLNVLSCQPLLFLHLMWMWKHRVISSSIICHLNQKIEVLLCMRHWVIQYKTQLHFKSSAFSKLPEEKIRWSCLI